MSRTLDDLVRMWFGTKLHIFWLNETLMRRLSPLFLAHCSFAWRQLVSLLMTIFFFKIRLVTAWERFKVEDELSFWTYLYILQIYDIILKYSLHPKLTDVLALNKNCILTDVLSFQRDIKLSISIFPFNKYCCLDRLNNTFIEIKKENKDT